MSRNFNTVHFHDADEATSDWLDGRQFPTLAVLASGDRPRQRGSGIKGDVEDSRLDWFSSQEFPTMAVIDAGERTRLDAPRIDPPFRPNPTTNRGQQTFCQFRAA
jgi:hypothetical protein